MSATSSKPEAFVLPRPPNHRMLRCAFGWAEATTKAFLDEEVDWLEFRGSEDQPFRVPPLGPKTKSIKRLLLAASGEIHGLEQFANIPEMDISLAPKNGIDLSKFDNLKSLRFEWEDKIARQVLSISNLRELDLIGYRYDDCVPLQNLSMLVAIAFTQGKLKSLIGLDRRRGLKKISLAYLRTFTDLDGISQFNDTEELSLANLPKLTGAIKIGAFPKLRSLYVVDSGLSVDLSELSSVGELEQLWLNVKAIKLSWDDLLSMPKLQRFAVVTDANAPSDDELTTLARRHRRRVVEVRRVGRRQTPQIQVVLS